MRLVLPLQFERTDLTDPPWYAMQNVQLEQQRSVLPQQRVTSRYHLQLRQSNLYLTGCVGVGHET